MTSIESPLPRLEPEPLPDNLRSVQPGGGYCYEAELAWGRLRRWYLKTYRPDYVRQMAELRIGSTEGALHEIIDPRDLKYCRNVCAASWPPEADLFAWRGQLPFARWGLAEMQLMGWPLVVLAIGLGCWHWWLSFVPLALLAFVLYFFRSPHRLVPNGPGLLVSPADGKVVEIARIGYDEFIGGPAVRIGIFLSVFNVHVNCAPSDSRVIRLRYRPGLFLNALNPESAARNEALWIGLEEEAAPYRRIIVRQIAGLIARRIVCELRSGQRVARGHKFGMIKLGSRTELIVPDEPNLVVEAQMGQTVQGGSTVLARYGQAATAG